MLDTTIKADLHAVNQDMHALIKDAQVLFQDAATMSGEKAAEARQRAMRMLDAAVVKAQSMSTSAVLVGKDMAISADHYVKENPWKTITTVAGFGLLAGFILGRR